jgi:hypothetical protein
VLSDGESTYVRWMSLFVPSMCPQMSRCYYSQTSLEGALKAVADAALGRLHSAPMMAAVEAEHGPWP